MLKKVYTYNYEYLTVIEQINCGNYRIISARDNNNIIYKGVTDANGIEIIIFSPEIISIKELKKDDKIIDRDFLVSHEDGFIYHYKIAHNECEKSNIQINSLHPINSCLYEVTNTNDKMAIYDFNAGKLMTPYVTKFYYNCSLEEYKFYDNIEFINKVITLSGTFDTEGNITFLKNGNTNQRYDISTTYQYQQLVKRLSYQLVFDSIKESIKDKIKTKR